MSSEKIKDDNDNGSSMKWSPFASPSISYFPFGLKTRKVTVFMREENEITIGGEVQSNL
mgnify:FL=1